MRAGLVACAEQCVAFCDKALDPNSAWCQAAAALDMGDEEEDGVHKNVAHFARLLASGTLKPAAAQPLTRPAAEPAAPSGRV